MCGDEQLRPLVDDRKADVHVVEVHVRRRVVPQVLDLVVDLETRLADPHLDPAAQQELLSEEGCLEHLALREEHALVALPALAVSDETGGAVRDAPVEAERLRLLRRVVVVLGRVLRHEQRVLEPAGREQTAAEVAEEAETLGLVEPGAGKADC